MPERIAYKGKVLEYDILQEDGVFRAKALNDQGHFRYIADADAKILVTELLRTGCKTTADLVSRVEDLAELLQEGFHLSEDDGYAIHGEFRNDRFELRSEKSKNQRRPLTLKDLESMSEVILIHYGLDMDKTIRELAEYAKEIGEVLSLDDPELKSKWFD